MAHRYFLPAKYRIASSVALISTPLLLSYGVNSHRILRNETASDKPWPKGKFQAAGRVTRHNAHSATKAGVRAAANREAEARAGAEEEASMHNENAETWLGEHNEESWSSFTTRFADAGSSLANFEWSNIGDRLADYITPDWVSSISGYVRKLQAELAMGPGSLTDEIRLEAEDASINPEILLSARVRMGKTLCSEELAFQRQRKKFTTLALARYLGIPEEEVNPEDVPTIAMCGSGGGLRALVAGTSSYMCTQQDGLFDCVTYTAGVSGSCWLQTLYHSSVAGQKHDRLVTHLKKRLGTHIAFPPAALNLLTTAPTNKFLLSGMVEKAWADPSADFGLVDIYGLLLGARLLVPRGELEVDDRDLKLSNQRAGVDNGVNPLPIYTAVRHEIPIAEDSEKTKFGAHHRPSESKKEEAKQESYFQWWEWTPYEFWCEEVDAGIPVWSLGRQFKNGVSVPRESGLGLPEMRVPQLLGIWGSAFCATLSHYYKEMRPLIQGIAGFGGLDDLIEQRNDDLAKVHPIDPATIPNFVLGLEDQLPPTTPKSMFNSSHLQLMDAGMSNNLPLYPLMRPGRDIDIIIAFDASADIKKENWLSVADGYAKQRNIKGWPMGTGWPLAAAPEAETARELDEASTTAIETIATKVHAATHKTSETSSTSTNNSEITKAPEGAAQVVPHNADPRQKDLGYCTVWIGAAEERDSPADAPLSKRFDSESDWELLSPAESGIAVVYFPLIPNPAVPGVDPDTTPFMSTWNFVYTPEDIDQVVALARSNYQEGAAQTKRCVRVIYERKRRLRLEREEAARKERWRRHFKGDGDLFRGG